MEDRVMRAMMAMEAAPKVTAGRMRCRMVPRLPDGSHPSRTANRYISIKPNQKTGVETPIRESTILE
jgi:hypothetical protein